MGYDPTDLCTLQFIEWWSNSWEKIDLESLIERLRLVLSETSDQSFTLPAKRSSPLEPDSDLLKRPRASPRLIKTQDPSSTPPPISVKIESVPAGKSKVPARSANRVKTTAYRTCSSDRLKAKAQARATPSSSDPIAVPDSPLASEHSGNDPDLLQEEYNSAKKSTATNSSNNPTIVDLDEATIDSWFSGSTLSSTISTSMVSEPSQLTKQLYMLAEFFDSSFDTFVNDDQFLKRFSSSIDAVLPFAHQLDSLGRQFLDNALRFLVQIRDKKDFLATSFDKIQSFENLKNTAYFRRKSLKEDLAILQSKKDELTDKTMLLDIEIARLEAKLQQIKLERSQIVDSHREKSLSCQEIISQLTNTHDTIRQLMGQETEIAAVSKEVDLTKQTLLQLFVTALASKPDLSKPN